MRYLFSLVVCSLLITSVSLAKDDNKAIKTINRSFKVNKTVNLEVTNKYGQIIINTWNKDSVAIKIKVTGYGKDKEASEKLLDRAEFEFNHVGQYVIAETVLDRSKGLIKDIWNSITDYSKTLLGKNKLTIDYEIYMPASGSVKVIQKFGDLYLENISGSVDLDIDNGNLKMDEVANDFRLNLSFGRANINVLRDGLINLRSAEFEAEKAQNIELQSSSSTLIVAKLRSLKIDSRNDKIRIDEIETLRGEGSFTTINIKNLKRTVLADMNYGELVISEVAIDFRDIQVKGESTDFDLMFARQSLIDVELVGLEEEMTLGYGKYEKTLYKDDEKLLKVAGTIGIGKESGGNVNVFANGGKVKVQYITH